MGFDIIEINLVYSNLSDTPMRNIVHSFFFIKVCIGDHLFTVSVSEKYISANDCLICPPMIVRPKPDHHLTFLGFNISQAAVEENKKKVGRS